MNILSKPFKSALSYKIPLYVLLIAILTSSCFYWYGSHVGKNQKDGFNRSHTMVKYLEETSEVAFLNVGIQDVQTQTNNSTIPWTKIGIPGSEKKAIIILNYAAKLGIKEAVKIDETEENHFHITVPKFEFIGVELDEDAPYQLYDSRGGLLSMTTKNIDTGTMVSQSLSKKSQTNYLEQYLGDLQASAQNYYTALFAAIDPEIVLTFTFED